MEVKENFNKVPAIARGNPLRKDSFASIPEVFPIIINEYGQLIQTTTLKNNVWTLKRRNLYVMYFMRMKANFFFV